MRPPMQGAGGVGLNRIVSTHCHPIHPKFVGGTANETWRPAACLVGGSADSDAASPIGSLGAGVRYAKGSGGLLRLSGRCSTCFPVTPRLHGLVLSHPLGGDDDVRNGRITGRRFIAPHGNSILLAPLTAGTGEQVVRVPCGHGWLDNYVRA